MEGFMFRVAAFACAATLMAATAPASADDASVCEATNVRVYFEHGSDALSPAAMDTLNAASRMMRGCAHKEIRVAVDASSVRSAARGRAVMAAMRDRGWNVARVEAQMAMSVAYASSPE